jgi:NADH:ubiquinone oxidoreductase subunit 5 (subunit L)/multisubunit Na+/H+ antiporter MnhA subunit
MVNNAIYKSNLFLMSGTVGKAAGSDEIENMGGLARQLPVSFACGLVSAAAISGVPPFNGFVSKWLIYQGCLDLHSGLGVALLVAAVFGSALTAASFVKIIYSAFLSSRPSGQAAPQAHSRESLLTAGPMIVLALACVALGLYPQPLIQGVLLPVAASVNPSGQLAIQSTAMTLSVGATGNWSPAAALGLILIGILAGLAIPAVFALRRVRRVRPFYSGEILAGDDRYRMPGTAFYQTIRSMRGIGPLLEQGARGSMDVYHMAGRYGQSLIELLRAQHTGLICLYVAWCVFGLAVTVIYLILSGIH